VLFVIVWTLCALVASAISGPGWRADRDERGPCGWCKRFRCPMSRVLRHMAVDTKGQPCLFRRAPANHRGIDLRSGKDIHTISGFGGDPRKTHYLPRPMKSGRRRRCHVQSV